MVGPLPIPAGPRLCQNPVPVAHDDRRRPRPLDYARSLWAHGRRAPARWGGLLSGAFWEWWDDKAPRMGGALAFYTVLSLAPLLVLVSPIAERVFGEEQARKQIVSQFRQLAGKQAADAVDAMLKAPGLDASPRPWTTALSVLVLVFGATGVFAELQESLNTVWEVAPAPGRGMLWEFVRQRLLSFAMVMGICFLLLVSLLLTAGLEALHEYANRVYGDRDAAEMSAGWQALNQAVSFLVVGVLFAMMYKVLPDATVAWRDVWIGAALASALFAVGRFAIGKYLGQAGIGQRYGAGGSLVALLIWVYYSSQILIFGAEFTKVYSRRSGHRVVPTEIAVPVTEEARAQEGIPHREVVEAVKEIEERRRGADGESGG